jgi:cytochrome c-type biogenesis protein CcmH
LALFWFLAGILSTLAVLVLLLPWLRTIPRFGPLPSLPWQAGVGACVMLAAVLTLYHWFGHPGAVEYPGAATAAMAGDATIVPGTPASAAPASGAASMSIAIADLENRLKKGGGTDGDWELLAKSFEFIGRPADAGKARAHQLPPLPPDAAASANLSPPAPEASAQPPATVPVPALSAESIQELAKANSARQNKRMKEAAAIYARLAARGQMNSDGWADYADAAATLQGGKLAGQPETFIANALAQNPLHPKALWLEASADEEAGRFAAAAAAWQRLQAVLPADSADAKIVAANLLNIARLAGSAGTLPADSAGAASAMVAGPAAKVSGEVSLAAGLTAKAAPGATLFIVAKAVDSPGPPVAVFRASVGAWPVKFTLDDSQSMLPGRNLSNAGRVTIEARISQTGQALPSAGDLQGTTGAVNPADHQLLKILIDRIIS